MSATSTPRKVIQTWDLPVRVTHWLLVLLVLSSWITAENHWLNWHRLSGYAILTLVLFRFYWGFVGSTPARFTHFLRGPRAVLGALFGTTKISTFGHNPLGGWSVVAMLSTLLLQAALGLFAVDLDGLESGPLAIYVSFEAGRQAAGLHATIFNLLLVLIGMHVLAILLYLWLRGENLILPMLTGRKRLLLTNTPPCCFVPLWRALLGLALAGVLVAGLVMNS